MEDFWNDKYVLMDLLLSTNMSQAEIAKELDVSQAFLSKQIKLLGLTWIKRKTHKVSRGQSSLTATLQKLLPNEHIENEHHVGDRLRLDVYCHAYKLAVEYHGRQHYEYVSRFFESYEDFLRAQERDQEKLAKCKELGITMVVFKYNDDLSEDVVYDRLLAALQADIPATPTRRIKKHGPTTKKGHPVYEEMKSRRKEFGKQMRDKIKEERKAQGQTIF